MDPRKSTPKKITPKIFSFFTNFYKFMAKEISRLILGIQKTVPLLFPCIHIMVIIFFLHLAASSLYAETIVGGHIGEDTVWIRADSPYIVTSSISVYGDPNTGVTLTIEPGVEVRFNQNTFLNIGNNGNKGALVAVGADTEPIVFTANTDPPIPGYWFGVYFNSGTMDEESRMEYCEVEYAGGYYYGAGIKIINASPTISHCQIKKSGSTGGYGIYCDNASPQLVNNEITDNSSHGIYLDNSSPTISGNKIAGLYATPGVSSAQITGNTFTNYHDFPILVGANLVGQIVENNTFEGIETSDQLFVFGGRISEDAMWKNVGVSYVISETISVYGDTTEGVTLTIEPGVGIRFNQNTFLKIGNNGNKGALVAEGTDTSWIVFTANKEPPNPGGWYGVYFDSGTMDEESRMEYCLVEYAGGYHNGAGIYLHHTSPRITNCQIRESLGFGIYCGNASPQLVNNEITDNSSHGIYLEISSPTISGNTIAGLFATPGVSFAQITGNIFTNYHDFPIQVGANLVGQIVENNTLEGIETSDQLTVIGGRISEDAVWKNVGVSYVISGSISVYGDTTEGVTLTIEPGVGMRFTQNTYLKIGDNGNKGALVAEGTDTSWIVFTADIDPPTRGYWYGIHFDSGTMDEESRMEYCEVEYAGGAYDWSYVGIKIKHASPTISHCQIKESYKNGIYCANASPQLVNNEITANSNYGLYIEGGTPEIVNNSIHHNTEGGIYCSGSGALMLMYNTIHKSFLKKCISNNFFDNTFLMNS